MGWTLIHRAFDKQSPYVPTPKVPLADFKKPAKFPTSFEILWEGKTIGPKCCERETATSAPKPNKFRLRPFNGFACHSFAFLRAAWMLTIFIARVR